MPDENPAPVDSLQFRRAEMPVPESKTCAACKQAIEGEYFQVRDQTICPNCAAQIEAGRQNQRKVPMLRPALYGLGAALAGAILYGVVAVWVQIGIVSLFVGWMVGSAVRNGAYGIGGRPQQWLAVGLTYFAISASIVPTLVVVDIRQSYEAKKAGKKIPAAAPEPSISKIKAIGGLIALVLISPFLELLNAPIGGLISLVILFVGLQRAWAITARQEILVSGPYS